ncbi:MAG: FKBP-type peptidyl-prolyl cis-trans isomerase [Lachnospiraceae bacterium]|nr:FKBP-type peptidyl-prolyl cis-trans isomerase [Lachnospiraceae bacterium]
MKKRLYLAMIATALVMSATACGNSTGETSATTESTETATEVDSTENTEDASNTENSDTETTTSSNAPYSEEDYTALDYVTLGDYSSFEVSINEDDYTVKESDVYDLIDEMIENAGAFVDDDTQDTVLEDSIIKADYVGSIDGVAFDGGSATDTIIDVANNSEASQGYSFIEGFTAGLPGAKVGDTVDCNVTFPEDYSEEDLAGKDAVFTFTIKAIEKKYTHENIDDEYVSANLGYSTVTALIAEANSTIKTNNENKRNSAIADQCVATLKENSTINSFPENMLDTRFEYSYQTLENNILNTYSMTIEQYAAYQGMTIDEYKEYLKSQIEESAGNEMILKAVVETENIEIDTAGYNEFVETLLTSYGYDDEDALYSAYAKSYVEYSYLIKKAKNLLVERANVTNEETSSETENTEEANTEAAEETSTESSTENN